MMLGAPVNRNCESRCRLTWCRALQEMMLGSLAMHCSRNAKIPLVLVPPGLSHS